MWLKDDMGYVNSAFQYALGKKVINTGSQNMIRLTTGHLYDLNNYKPLEDSARSIADLNAVKCQLVGCRIARCGCGLLGKAKGKLFRITRVNFLLELLKGC